MDDHKRVEAYNAFVNGSGLAANPENIEKILNDAARFERTYVKKPEKTFAEVLSEKSNKMQDPSILEQEKLLKIEKNKRELGNLLKEGSSNMIYFPSSASSKEELRPISPSGDDLLLTIKG